MIFGNIVFIIFSVQQLILTEATCFNKLPYWKDPIGNGGECDDPIGPLPTCGVDLLPHCGYVLRFNKTGCIDPKIRYGCAKTCGNINCIPAVTPVPITPRGPPTPFTTIPGPPPYCVDLYPFCIYVLGFNKTGCDDPKMQHDCAATCRNPNCIPLAPTQGTTPGYPPYCIDRYHWCIYVARTNGTVCENPKLQYDCAASCRNPNCIPIGPPQSPAPTPGPRPYCVDLYAHCPAVLGFNKTGCDDPKMQYDCAVTCQNPNCIPVPTTATWGTTPGPRPYCVDLYRSCIHVLAFNKTGCDDPKMQHDCAATCRNPNCIPLPPAQGTTPGYPSYCVDQYNWCIPVVKSNRGICQNPSVQHVCAASCQSPNCIPSGPPQPPAPTPGSPFYCIDLHPWCSQLGNIKLACADPKMQYECARTCNNSYCISPCPTPPSIPEPLPYCVDTFPHCAEVLRFNRTDCSDPKMQYDCAKTCNNPRCLPLSPPCHPGATAHPDATTTAKTGIQKKCRIYWTSLYNSCYQVYIEFSYTFTEGEQACRQRAKNGHLVSIESREENDFVINLARKVAMGNFFIGLHTDTVKSASKTDWYWTSDPSKKANYFNWDADEPSYALKQENVAILKTKNGRWTDVPVDYKERTGFICEYPL